MATQIEQSLSSTQNKELKRLKRTRSRRILHTFLFFFFLIFLGYYFKKRVFTDDINSATLESARSELTELGIPWTQNLNKDQLALQSWIERRGTAIEVDLFSKVSTVLFISAKKSLVGKINEGELGLISSFYLSLHYGLLRVSFIIIACFRLWLIVVAFAIYRGYKSLKSYDGPDMLGQTGNSRMFYSGIRAGLENLASNGAPNKQVRGLACPKFASEAKLKSSALYRILDKYQVANKTNSRLAAMIIEYSKLPAYISSQEEEKLLAGFVDKSNLEENATAILERILDLHGFYVHGQKDKDFSDYLEDFREYEGNPKKLKVDDYARYLQKLLHRSLTVEMREIIAGIPSSYICSMALSLEAGKILVFRYEGERWLRNSNYPQLCARSILHSVESFADEHDFVQRTIIRQAIIYSSRSGDFGPVKLPIDLNDESRTMRQWAEILIANPHDLYNVTNEVEMYGIVYEAHKKYKQILFDKIMVGDKEMLAGTYATLGNLFLIPFNTIYKLTKMAVSSKALRRLEELARLESYRQKLKIVQTDNLIDGGEKVIPANSKVFDPFTDAEIKTLSATYKIPVQSLKEWSALRIVLNNFGWLARRVGDYSVPESSLIFAVIQTENNPDANSLGLIGAPGMVPLRATQLEERWGKTWHSRTTEVVNSTMAENQEDYELLLRGESVDDFEDNTIVNL